MLQTRAKKLEKIYNSTSVKYVDLTELNKTLGKPSPSGDERESKTFHLPKKHQTTRQLFFLEKRKYYVLVYFFIALRYYFLFVFCCSFMRLSHGGNHKHPVLIFFEWSKAIFCAEMFSVLQKSLKWPDF